MKETKILNWIALVWTVLGGISMLDSSTTDIWGVLYLGILVAAQILALKHIK